MHCLSWGQGMAGRKRRYCGWGCRDAAYYQRKHGRRSPLLPLTPVLHHGVFQDYADRYAGLVDVIITDLPYARKALPIYADLAQFALTTLVPGGWLLCLTGWGIDLEVRQGWQDAGLEFVTVGCYHMPSPRSKGKKRASTDWRIWKEHHKPLLWYQKRGFSGHHRRGFPPDTIEPRVVAPPDMDQAAREWQQSLAAFKEIVRIFTNPGDVICDPCMGWGTTVVAAVSQERRRVIGIEMLAERYAYAAAQRDCFLGTAAAD